MTASEWAIVIGVVTSSLMALGPWMFMVHAKLAVVLTQVSRLEAKVDKMTDAQQDRLTWCIQHQTAIAECSRRLDAHEARFEQLGA